MQFILPTITLILVFTTIYSYGESALKLIHKKEKFDIFFKIFIGYILIGSLTVIYHFFFKISDLFSVFIICVGLFLFSLNYKSLNKKKFLKLVFLIVILSFIIIGYSDHPIDTNMYHHPYVSYLKSEKIVFAIANIQFRFGHISFLQYVQASLTNNFLHEISLASINLIFYICFVYLFSREIIKAKQINLLFVTKILFLSFILIKFSRYREYGNDLIPLLVSIYFLIKILNVRYENVINKEKLINIALPFAAFMFLHKISYTFVFLIFLCLFSFKNFKEIKKINFIYIVISISLIVPWLIKNYIVTSCFAYPLELSCYTNTFYELKGMAKPANAAWLTEIWAKGFIDHPNWREISLKEYAYGFNWVPTWFYGHFIKIVEIISPLLFVIFLFTIFFFFKKNDFIVIKKNNKISKKLFYLWMANFLGLSIWFYNAPVFRYGSFYVISFIILSFILFFDYFLTFKNSKKLKFFKIILLISIFFFIFKNIQRMSDAKSTFFPKTSKKPEEFTTYINDKLKLISPKNELCYFTNHICSHEIPKNILIINFGYYDIIN